MGAHIHADSMHRPDRPAQASDMTDTRRPPPTAECAFPYREARDWRCCSARSQRGRDPPARRIGRVRSSMAGPARCAHVRHSGMADPAASFVPWEVHGRAITPTLSAGRRSRSRPKAPGCLSRSAVSLGRGDRPRPENPYVSHAARDCGRPNARARRSHPRSR
jgi:hypothetical protein